jgi:hypothetical protein
VIPQTLQNNPSLERWVSFPTKGRVRVAVGKSEYGQGMLTGLAQIGRASCRERVLLGV